MSSAHKKLSHNINLLAADKGSRMGDITQGKGQRGLECCGKAMIDRMLEAIIARNEGEIVVVTGCCCCCCCEITI